MPPFIARSMPKILPTAAPAPAPTLPSAGACARRGLAGGIAGRRVGPDALRRPAAGRTAPRPARSAGAPGRPSCRRPARPASASRRRPHPGPTRCRRPAGCRAPARPRWTGASRSVSRVPGAAPRTSTPADRAAAREHHRAAGGPAGVGEVADLDAGDVGDGEQRHCDCAITRPCAGAGNVLHAVQRILRQSARLGFLQWTLPPAAAGILSQRPAERGNTMNAETTTQNPFPTSTETASGATAPA